MDNKIVKESKKRINSLNKTALLITGLVILTGILLIVSLTSKSILEPSKKTQKEEVDFAQTSLAFSESPRVGTESGTYEMDIRIDSKDNKITGAQLEMSFDPRILNRVDIRPGDFIDNPVVLFKDVNSANGRIKYYLGIPSNAKGVSGDGTIATIIFSKNNNSETEINFLPKTSIHAQGFNQSVLRETVSALIGNISSNSPTTNSATRVQ